MADAKGTAASLPAGADPQNTLILETTPGV